MAVLQDIRRAVSEIPRNVKFFGILGVVVVTALIATNVGKDKPGATWSVIACELERGPEPTLRVEGDIKNLSDDVHGFSIEVTAWDGRFVVAVTDAIRAVNMRPGEEQHWRGSGPADSDHELPAVPRCTTEVTVLY